MKAQNKVGRNTTEFVNWINSKTKTVSTDMSQLFFEAWKEGFEPAAVFEYLFNEINIARVSFGIRMTGMEDMDLSQYETFQEAYAAYREKENGKAVQRL